MPTRTFDHAFSCETVLNGRSPKSHKKSKSVGHFSHHNYPVSAVESDDISTLLSPETTPRQTSDALNVIIPIGGIGSRFQKEGYRFPKPLINIAGRPMICWLIEKLSLRPEDTLWVAINEGVDNEFQIGQLLKKWFPKLDARLLRLKYLTKGATETLFIVTQSMSAEHLSRRTVSLDCDTIYFADVLSSVRRLPEQHGACFYFKDDGPAPIFSYIRTDENDLIIEIQEKRAISNKANSGAYVFPSAQILRTWSARGLDSKLDGSSDVHKSEYFTSLLISQMIHSGEVHFLGVPIEATDFSCVGTPPQLHAFLQRLKNKDSQIHFKKQRFCFDLDMTLVGTPEVTGDYSTCPPIWRNIKLVQQLHEAGHHIIIQTARRMKTHKGNVGAVIADVGTITFQSLERYEIPYDEVFFGKPWADIYVDDLAVHANMDTRREIGWMAEEGMERKTPSETGLVAPRSFNHVQVVGDRFIKSSKSSAILGEMYFYSRIPDALRDIFPRLHSIRFEPETSTYSMSLPWLKGVTYSHLLVGRSLTHGRFNAFLRALHEVHHASSRSTSKFDIPLNLQHALSGSDCDQSVEHIDIYANYGRKVRQRYDQYREDYTALGPETTVIANELLERLTIYEKEQRGLRAEVIHGDPVFSNAILDETQGKVHLFDVRAMQGSKFALGGDVCYDLAKVFQSLQGYDHALLRAGSEDFDGIYRNNSRMVTPELESNGRTNGSDNRLGRDLWLEDIDQHLLADLQSQFWEFVCENYPAAKVRRDDIICITASLLFSLIPLHRAEIRPVFLEMCKSVLKQGQSLRP